MYLRSLWASTRMRSARRSVMSLSTTDGLLSCVMQEPLDCRDCERPYTNALVATDYDDGHLERKVLEEVPELALSKGGRAVRIDVDDEQGSPSLAARVAEVHDALRLVGAVLERPRMLGG